MRAGWSAVLIILLLFHWGLSQAARAELSIEDLDGVWVPESSLNILRETLSPSAAGGAQVVINKEQEVTGYKLRQTNFREGSQWDVLALSRTKISDVYKLRLRHDLGSEGKGEPEDYFVKLKLGAGGSVDNIIFTGGVVDPPYQNIVFVRIPVPWNNYVNRLVFAGIWEDRNGDLFSFCECGEGQAVGGRSFHYKVPFSLLPDGDDDVWVKPGDFFQAEALGYYHFKRIKDELYLFTQPHGAVREIREGGVLKRR